MSVSPAEQRYRAIRRVTLVGAVVNVLLAAAKIFFGVLSQSYALIADGIHSLSDLATDVLVVYAARSARHGADAEHPYGHGRIETAFTVALGLLLIAIAVGIMVDAGRRLLSPAQLLQPTLLALLVAAVAMSAKEALYHYTIRIALRVRSSLLRTNAWHHRSDAISTVLVFVGVAGSLLGFGYLDAFAAVGVALMIAKIGWDAGWNATLELVDTGLEPERVAEIRTVIEDVDGVRDLHTLRTRRMGGDALVDVHVQVDARLSVSEGHHIGEYVRSQLLDAVEEVNDVTIHVDPENDADSHKCNGLPLRREVLKRLRQCWQPIVDVDQIRGVTLHYLSGKIHVDLLLPLGLLSEVAQADDLDRALRNALVGFEEIGLLRVFYIQ